MSRVIEKEKKLSELNYAFTVEGFQIALQLTTNRALCWLGISFPSADNRC
jgi:hypothetical protein